MTMDSNFGRVYRQLKDNEERALEAIGIFVRGEAQVRCPVDTGNLKNSIDYKVLEAQKKVVIGTNVEYAIYVEKGTRKMRAQPYLTPALEENKKRIEELAAEYLGRGLR